MLLANKVALITGANGGIGRGIATAFVENGSNIILSDIEVSSLSDFANQFGKLKRKVTTIKMDVTSSESIKNGLHAILEEYGEINILVNNAGVCIIHPFLEITEEDWDLIFDVNIKSIFLCSKIFSQQFAKQGGGRIINIASNAGKVGFPNQADYNASKAAVINLTRSLAEELAPMGINVNAVCPGAVKTNMLIEIAQQIGSETNQNPEELLNSFAPKQLGRLIEPIEVGHVVAFLASDYANIIRGQSINIDGGNTPY
jgi:NAD(P)-dependent dehydrogenase (short-subunit alcohol dehydrogenase family)